MAKAKKSDYKTIINAPEDWNPDYMKWALSHEDELMRHFGVLARNAAYQEEFKTLKNTP